MEANMYPVSIETLYQFPRTDIDDHRIRVQVQNDWAVENENRIGWTVISRLAECARDLHWRRLQESVGDAGTYDLALTGCTARYRSPIIVNSRLEITFGVTGISDSTYDFGVNFNIAGQPTNNQKHAAELILAIAFVDPTTFTRLTIPDAARSFLESSRLR